MIFKSSKLFNGPGKLDTNRELTKISVFLTSIRVRLVNSNWSGDNMLLITLRLKDPNWSGSISVPGQMVPNFTAVLSKWFVDADSKWGGNQPATDVCSYVMYLLTPTVDILSGWNPVRLWENFLSVICSKSHVVEERSFHGT